MLRLFFIVECGIVRASFSPLDLVCAKFRFFRDLCCWACPLKKNRILSSSINQSINHPAFWCRRTERFGIVLVSAAENRLEKHVTTAHNYCNHLRVTVLQLVGTHINSLSTVVVLMCENILVSVLSKCGTVSRQALLVLSHNCRLEIL